MVPVSEILRMPPTSPEHFSLQDLVRIRKNPERPHIYDVELWEIPALQAYDSVEAHIVLYPYSRAVSAKHFTFHPY